MDTATDNNDNQIVMDLFNEALVLEHKIDRYRAEIASLSTRSRARASESDLMVRLASSCREQASISLGLNQRKKFLTLPEIYV
jgi:hypothetical protein